MAVFPSETWLDNFVTKLNRDERYAQVAGNWEGDMLFLIEPGGALAEKKVIYLDLWHGKCRDAYFVDAASAIPAAAFTLQAPYPNYVRIMRGELDPMQAMLTRKLKVSGNMAYMLRNVQVVLDFVRCLREVSDDFLE
ncbi:MAG: SCP2 sterol-binding domain-containing protein [Anaerolineales bacterium]